METVKTLLNAMWEYAPDELHMDGDNVGLLAGRLETEVQAVLLCLDITTEMVREAASLGAKLIISHHPMLFSLRRATAETAPALLALLEHGMSAICMHTNLDAAAGGVNDTLARRVGLEEITAYSHDAKGRPCGLYRTGLWPSGGSAREFAVWVKSALNAPEVQLLDAGHPVHRVGLCSGSGVSELENALAHGCDTFLTGEVKYNQFLEAAEHGVNLLAAGHFATENVVLEPVESFLRQRFPQLHIQRSQLQKTPYEII